MTYGQMLVVGSVTFVSLEVCAWLGVCLGPRHERARRLFAAIGAPALLALYLLLSLRAVRSGVVHLDAPLGEQWTAVIITSLVAMVGIALMQTIWSIRQGRGRPD